MGKTAIPLNHMLDTFTLNVMLWNSTVFMDIVSDTIFPSDILDMYLIIFCFFYFLI